jgi:hypothetical protein
MPYQGGERLPPERASKLGHLDVLKSELVQKLCKSFEDKETTSLPSMVAWETLPVGSERLAIVFGVDGSIQTIQSSVPPHKALAFVKTALLRLDEYALAQVNKHTPHPLALRDILADSALYHATVFPLRNVQIPGFNTYHAIRQIIYESVCDASLNREPLETLKWIAYEKWDGNKKRLPLFECPHCEENIASLAYDSEEGPCPKCHEKLYVTDMLGFHQEMAQDAAPDSVANAYMAIHETLLLFSAVRYFWEHSKGTLTNCLFVKDGPLSIRAQYSKLVAPIRRFLSLAAKQGYPVHIIGQEKTGRFADHLGTIGESAPAGAYFIPGDAYIKEQIQHRPIHGAPYGKDTNYGAKVLVKLNAHHQMVLNIPTGDHKPDPKFGDLIGAGRIFATIPSILSNRYEGGLLPVELANGLASLSTYPSARILEIFADATRRNEKD